MIAVSLLILLAPANTVAKADPADRIICQRDIRTGTRFARKICMSQRAWNERAEVDSRAMGEMRSRSHTRDIEH